MIIENDESLLVNEINSLAVETAVDFRRNKTVLIPVVLLAILVIELVFFFTSVLPSRKTAEAAGQLVGASSGSIAGTAVGSVEGVTTGLAEGYAEGKEEGLSAKDTIVEIANTIESNVNELGRLEVLVANVDLTNYHEVGSKYGALYLMRGSAVFTVDLSEAAVTYNESLVSIVLPQPTAEIKFDPTEIERLSEWQRIFFNGSDSEGFQSQLNSYTAPKNISETEVANYATLREFAAESARKQVEEIANAVCGKTISVTVSTKSD